MEDGEIEIVTEIEELVHKVNKKKNILKNKKSFF